MACHLACCCDQQPLAVCNCSVNLACRPERTCRSSKSLRLRGFPGLSHTELLEDRGFWFAEEKACQSQQPKVQGHRHKSRATPSGRWLPLQNGSCVSYSRVECISGSLAVVHRKPFDAPVADFGRNIAVPKLRSKSG